MTMTTRPTADLSRHERTYRALLVVYPRSFRQEYGEDMVQAFRDLLLYSSATDGGTARSWLRTVRDLVTSATNERRSGWSRRPPIVLVVALLLILLLGAQSTESLLVIGGFLALIAAPIVGMQQLQKATVIHRTTGERVRARVIIGVACFLPAIGFLVLAGPDRGWWLLMTVMLFLITTAVSAIVWAVTLLVSSGSANRRRRALVAGLVGVLILSGMAAAGYNSYRKNQGPPGDHSVENASADTRALWEAARAGDVDEVERLAQTCADPWVQFPAGDGKHRAKGIADTQVLELPDDEEAPYEEIMAVLADAEDTWFARCGPDTPSN
jgi:hypothetical protein